MIVQAQRRIAAGLAVFVGIVAVATLWYWQVEDFALIDSLYQTIITVSTVGFGEVEPMDATARAFTIGVIIIGVGAGFYALAGMFEYVVGLQVGRLGRKRLEKTIEKLSGHGIVCGYGRIGSKVAELLKPQMDVIVIEQNPELGSEARDDGFITVIGDATDDEVLEEVHIDHAQIVIAALPTDADNLYIVLSARSLNEGLHIVSRAQHASSGAKLVRAGADRVVNPEDIGAQRIAAFATRPAVSDFLEVVMHGSSIEYRLEEIRVGAASSVAGLTLGEAGIQERTGATLLAIKPPNEEITTELADVTALVAGTTLIAFGTNAQLSTLQEMVA